MDSNKLQVELETNNTPVISPLSQQNIPTTHSTTAPFKRKMHKALTKTKGFFTPRRKKNISD